MTRAIALDELWESTPPCERVFAPGQLGGLPDPAQRYLEHTIGSGTRLASAVRLRMHGEIKLKHWFPFSAEQVIRSDGAMVWRARVQMYGLPIRGCDQLVDGQGEMRWKLFGLIPLVSAAGPDITRSAAGRVAAESVWLPSRLCHDDVSWTAQDSSHARASFTVLDEQVEIALTVEDPGGLQSLTLERWGNPAGGAFGYADFGGVVEDEGTFGGYTIPTRLRIGWHFGGAGFDSRGEFFRVTIDDVRYR